MTHPAKLRLEINTCALQEVSISRQIFRRVAHSADAGPVDPT
jgi:hypothetical protein